MNIIETTISGLKIIKPHVFSDERGYFMESFKSSDFSETTFIQDNESKSRKGVLRGLHFQMPPFAQTKLIRVTSGEILDIVVDLRYHSPTFGQFCSVTLNSDHKYQLLVPKGCAHGFRVLSQNATVNYKIDAPYRPEQERGLRFDDPILNIDWGETEGVILSPKDRELPLFNPNDFQGILW